MSLSQNPRCCEDCRHRLHKSQLQLLIVHPPAVRTGTRTLPVEWPQHVASQPRVSGGDDVGQWQQIQGEVAQEYDVVKNIVQTLALFKGRIRAFWLIYLIVALAYQFCNYYLRGA